MLDGIVLVDKPSGWTSHDVVARMRRLAGQKRIGHTGTLDPMATGLLVVCLGNATRLVEYMTGHDKRYAGTIVLGSTTDTDDAEGAVVAMRDVPPPADVDLEAIRRKFLGPLMQMPPSYSAISVGGKRAYDIARAGGDPGLKLRPVVIHDLALRAIDGATLAINVHCGPGTYIRSLARDIGAAIGCGGHLGSLRRVSAGHFSVDAAYTLEELGAAAEAGLFAEALLAADDGILGMDAAVLGVEKAALVGSGIVVAVSLERTFVANEAVRVYTSAGAFLGIAELREGELLHASKVMRAANLG